MASTPNEWTLEIGGIPCAVYQGPDGTQGPTEGADEHGRRATVIFQCEWASRNDLIGALVGTVDYPLGANLVQRTPPFSYPLSTLDTTPHPVNSDPSMFIREDRLVCTSISRVQGTQWRTDNEGTLFPDLPGWGGFALALITAEFTCPNYTVQIHADYPAFTDPSQRPYVITKTRVSAEVLAPPTGSFTFQEGSFQGQPLLDVGAAQPRARLEINMTRVRMPLIPLKTVTPLLGTINLQDFTLGRLTFPPGTVLFNGMNPEPRSDPYHGGLIWDIEYQFLANGQAFIKTLDKVDYLDWNRFLDPKGDWVLVTYPNGIDSVFRDADFAPLFDDQIS